MDLASLQTRFSFEVSQDTDFAFGQNITPANAVLAITEDPQGRLGSMMRWGLVPNWSRSPKPKIAPINAKAETLTNFKIFRSLLYGHRCLVPADSFYVLGRKRGSKPVRLLLKSQETFAFAGLWEHWPMPGIAREPFDSFTIITTVANDLVAPLDRRMPVILLKDAEAMWLDASVPLESALPLLRPYPADEMIIDEALVLANNMLAKGPALIASAQRL